MDARKLKSIWRTDWFLGVVVVALFVVAQAADVWLDGQRLTARSDQLSQAELWSIALVGLYAVLLRASLVECKLDVSASTTRDALGSVAWLVNQHLARKERMALWGQLNASRCPTLGADERQWLQVHAAVGAADPVAMAATAASLLTNPESLPRELLIRVLASRMAGLIRTDQARLANREFDKFRGKLGTNPITQTLFRFLLGQADRGLRSAPVGRAGDGN